MQRPFPTLRPGAASWLLVLLLLALLLAGGAARAQSLSRLEYYFDTDPGYGQGRQQVFPSASPTQDYTFTADMTGLTPGYHTLYTRVLSRVPGTQINPRGPLGPFGVNAAAGEPNYLGARQAWSIANVRPVYVGPVNSTGALDDLTYLEYYFDVDPGYRLGRGVTLSAPAPGITQSYVADLSGLTPGFHTMYTRVKNRSGAWSISDVRALYVGPVSSTGTPANLTYLEYYFDTDPGYRQGTRVNFTTPSASVAQTFIADLTTVSNGFHTLFVRARNAAGAWSISNARPFVKSSVTSTAAAPNITRCEYFIDTDPGHGRGTDVPITAGSSVAQSFTADLSAVSNGVHTLFVRVRDASKGWSLVSVRPFVRQGSLAGAARPVITQLRYQVFPRNSNVPVGAPEYYVLPQATRAADVNLTFPTNICVTAAGDYVLRVTALDANRLPAIEFAHPFNVSTPSQFNPNLPATVRGCTGQPVTLTSAAAGTGGSYQWSRNGLILGGETGQSLSVSTAGTYAVTVTSASGCVGSGSSDVFFDPAPVVSLPLYTDVACGVEGALLDAGAGFTSYQWSREGTPISGATSQTLAVTTPGLYAVSVTASGTGTCTGTGSTTVRMPRATISPASQTVCAGTSVTLSLATPTYGTVLWSTGATGNSITVAPTATTTYSATVTDGAASCAASVTLTVPPALPLDLPAETVVACDQTSTLLDAGAGGTSYQWTLNGGNIGGATGRTLAVSAPGLYGVTVSNGCAKSDQTTVVMPHADIAQASQTICTGGSITLSLAAPAHGSILWSTGATTSSITVSPAANTTYSVTVSDQGQSCTDAVTIGVTSPPVVSLPADSSPACGTGSVTLTPGAGAGAYVWSTGATTPTISVTTPGTYSVTASNGSCSSTATTYVALPRAIIGGLATQRVCTGSSITLSLTAPINGSILWSNGATTSSITVSPTAAATYSVTVTDAGHSCAASVDVVVDPLPTVTLAAPDPVCANVGPLTLSGGLPTGGTYAGPGVSGGVFNPAAVGAGTYSITYSYTNANGCAGSASRSIVVNPAPAVTLSAFSSVCREAAQFTLSGGAPAGGAYSGPGVTDGRFFNPALTGAGTFTLTYTFTEELNGCSNAATQTITVLPMPVVVASAPTVCAGSSTTISVVGAGPGASYAWSTGATGSSISVSPGSPTTYTVAVTNAAGCAYNLSQLINISPSSTPPLAVSEMRPVDNSAGLDTPINFSWSPGANSTATSFDLYIWPSAGAQPGAPTVGGITSLQYSYSGSLSYGAGYQWRIVAVNPCGSTAGPVQTFRLRQLPDLLPTLVQAPDTAYAGQSVQVTWNISNPGPASTLAQQWQDAVYFSQNPTFDGAAKRLGRTGNVTYLQPNGTYISTATFAVPLNMAGRYYVFVRADEDGQLPETDETNNVAVAATRTLVIVPSTPDLAVQNISHFSTIIGGDTLDVAYRVKNIGEVNLAAAWTDAAYISPDTVQNIVQNTGQGLLGPTARRQLERPQARALLQNAEYQDALKMPIPHTFQGKFYVYTFADDRNDIFELASTNNVNPRLLVSYPAANGNPAFTKREYVPITVTLRPPPDLVVSAGSIVIPATATAGTALALSWQGKNQGANKPYPRLETYWSDQVWLCPDATFNPATAIALGSRTHLNGDQLSPNAPNNTYAVSATLALPNGLSGNYYVYVKTDAGNQIFENTDEDNNLTRSAGRVAVNLVYADLRPTALSAPASVSAFQTFTVSYSVQNTSTAVVAAAGTWADAITVSDAAGNAFTAAVNPRTGPLAIGASYNGTATVSLPNNFVPGLLTVRVTANVSGSLYEYTHGGNNSRTTTLNYIYSDDLAVSNLASSPAAFSGQDIGVSWRVSNLGLFRTLASGWSDQVFLSVDNQLDNGDLMLGSFGSLDGQLAAGLSYNQSQTVTLPQGLSGGYFLLVRTANSPNGALADTDPANNLARLALPISLTPPADLRIVATGPNAPTFPTSALAGQSVAVTFRVENLGIGATPVSSWNDGVYLNTSPTLDGATRIAVVPRGTRLAAGASYDVTTNVTIPGYLAGSYYLFLATDNNAASGYGPAMTFWGGAVQVGQVYEHQAENNNTYRNPTTINITVPLPADLVVTTLNVPLTTKLGSKLGVSYSIKNQGANPAVGLLKDGLYLSGDRQLSPDNDHLIATTARNLTIAPGETITGVLKDRVQALNPGTYHGIVSTNLFNDVFETNYLNDTLSQKAKTTVGVNVLPLDVLTPFALGLDSLEFYKVTPGAGVDMRLALGSNRDFGLNEVYVGYNRVPTAADYDFIYENPVSTRQELLIPSTGPGAYYILVKTPYSYTSVGGQTASLLAQVLPFQVRSIDADTVGRGRVTTRVLGAGFARASGPTAGTRFYLTRGTDPAVVSEARVLRFRSSVEVSLRWELTAVPEGRYHVVAEQADGSKVQLTNGLLVEPNSGLLVDFASIIPPTLRVQTPGNWTYFLTNSSNVDIPYWEFQFAVPVGADAVATHTPNVRKKSDFAPALPRSNTPANGFVSGQTEVLPFVARDLRPGEVVQVNLRMVPPISFEELRAAGGRVHFPVVLNQQPAGEERFTRRTLDFIKAYRAAVLANPAGFAPGVAALAQDANPLAWQDSLTRHYARVGLLDLNWAEPLHNPRATYNFRNDQTAVPGGVANDYWTIEQGYHNFRPDLFTDGLPAALRPVADSVFFAFNSRGASSTAVVAALDPNQITGPAGYGPTQMVGMTQPLNYKIEFENDGLLATGPAQRVRIEQPLSSRADARNFRLGDFGFGEYTFAVPAGVSTYTKVLDLPAALGYKVRVVAGVDVVGQVAFWEFQTFDPLTGQPPVDPLIGFLAPSDPLDAFRGHGFVNYRITAKPGAFTGDLLAAQASIIFDQNPPVITNTWTNTIDAVAPGSTLSALPATQASPTVRLLWSAADDAGGSGVRSFDVYAATDGGAFAPVAMGVLGQAYDFVGQPGSRYDFFIRATDNTDNQERLKTAGEAFTVIDDVLTVYNQLKNQCLTSETITSTGAGTWQKLLLNGEVVAAINDQGNSLGTVRVEFSVMSGGAVRADGQGTRYLDRNWRIVAQNSFSGATNPVLVRFYGLMTEYETLRLAAPAVVTSPAALRLTQYSGPNEDCLLSNNSSAAADRRLLTPATTTRADRPWFVAEVRVADHFSEFYLHGGEAPLPVELTRFTAQRQGRDVRATWRTATERNSAYFALEASAQPTAGFREVGRLPAAGLSATPRDYTLTEPNVPRTGGPRYYRLRQVDLDGSAAYGPVAVVQLEHLAQPLTLSAAPNPFGQQGVRLHIAAPAAADATLQVTDLAGRLVLNRRLQLPAGASTLALPELRALPSGIYVLLLRSGGELRQQRLVRE